MWRKKASMSTGGQCVVVSKGKSTYGDEEGQSCEWLKQMEVWARGWLSLSCSSNGGCEVSSALVKCKEPRYHLRSPMTRKASAAGSQDKATVEIVTWRTECGKFWELNRLWCQGRSCCQDFCSADDPSALINLQIMWQSFQQGSANTDGSIDRCLCVWVRLWNDLVQSRGGDPLVCLSYEKKKKKQASYHMRSLREKVQPARDWW